MENLFLQDIEYKVETTNLGTWKRFMYSNGQVYSEFSSHSNYMGLPLIHFVKGRCPETGRRKFAKGIIAIGRMAVGFLAIGQLSFGLVAVGQAGFGLLFGLGQLSTGLFALGQAAIGFYMAVGQLAAGYIAIGQFAFGGYVLAQAGFGRFVYSVQEKSAEAAEFFKPILDIFKLQNISK